jgi:iron complex transport system ATP-binding protein
VTAVGAALAIELSGVSAAYGRRVALADVGMRVLAGERLALVGRNGAGKSTLLRVIAGTLGASSGSVLLDGRPIAELDRAAIARRLAVVPQQASLPFSMRVEEVVGLGRLPHEDPFRGHRPADRAAVAAAIERVGLAAFVGRDARELSLGERQLVLVAMALAQGAGILLLDEPTVHLDLRHQVDVLGLLRDLNERDGVTVVAVLHDVGLAARTFPRLVLVDRGRIVADGPPDVVLAPERIRDVFGVDPGFVRMPAST